MQVNTAKMIIGSIGIGLGAASVTHTIGRAKQDTSMKTDPMVGIATVGAAVATVGAAISGVLLLGAGRPMGAAFAGAAAIGGVAGIFSGLAVGAHASE
ncbi:MAG: hypothetical protein JWN72_2667 [Thermoleophilia bacterium]|nr:hypothetical protein [Thermoleophilia bacterium]